jgi:hypothetical protein
MLDDRHRRRRRWTVACKLKKDLLPLSKAILDVVAGDQHRPPHQDEIRVRHVKLPYFCLRSPLSVIIVT